MAYDGITLNDILLDSTGLDAHPYEKSGLGKTGVLKDGVGIVVHRPKLSVLHQDLIQAEEDGDISH
ncbi:hypothetical protein CVT25_013633 [Psilocybe cyanescens]|uniref:Uncharacterized protein n=1 Tax=Psilocybe cyanescens TaxID=93625 RepID=A0A409WTE7_PSICY|nr:hypothetical protein CVT25_013633 [Psilocybe cyanescens]